MIKKKNIETSDLYKSGIRYGTVCPKDIYKSGIRYGTVCKKDF